MDHDLLPYLGAYRVASTDNFEQMQHVAAKVYDARVCELVDDAVPFSARASHFPFGTSSLSYCNYGAPTRIEFRDDSYLRIQFGINGAGRTMIGRSWYEVDGETLVTSPPDAALEFGVDFEQLVLRVSCDDLQQDLGALLGRTPKGDFAFEPRTAVSAAAAGRLREQVFHTVRMIDLANDPLPAALLCEMEQALRLAILYGIPNDFSTALRDGEKVGAPWQVRAVEEWIDAHWREGVTVEKLVDISGASARSIFVTFQNARGYTPMAYLKKVRLAAARDILLRAAPETTVTGVMFACGFASQGHFARDYRLAFGELPSDTLRRGRQRQY